MFAPIRLPGRMASVALAAAVLACSGLPASAQFRVVALSGVDNAYGPNLGAGVFFATISSPAINSAGQILFRGATGTTAATEGSWARWGVLPTDVNSVVALASNPLPGGGSFPTTSGIFNSLILNDNIQPNGHGQVAFRIGAATGVLGDTGGGLGRVAYINDAAPGTVTSGPLANYSASSAVASGHPLLNNSGQIAYIGTLATNATTTPPVVTTAGVANTSGIWSGTPGAGNQTLLLRQNDAITSLDAGGAVRAGAFTTASMAFNGAGRYVVQDTLQGTVTTGTGAGGNSVAILSNRSGALGAIARVGNPAPDSAGVASATDLYRTFGGSQLGFNDAGHVAFVATLRNAAGTQTNTSALFTDTGSGTLREIGRNGGALPVNITRAVGAEFSGVTWVNFSNTMLNSGGTLAFSASLGGTAPVGSTGLFRMAPNGDLTKIIRSGQTAIPGGAPDGSDVRYLNLSSVQINAGGEMIFSTSLTGTGVSVGLGNGQAIFGVDYLGSAHLLARTGDLFTVAPGDIRTITGIGGMSNTGGQDGRARVLTDDGQVVLQLEFAGGTSGIFVTAVPAPGSAALLALGGLAGARRRRR